MRPILHGDVVTAARALMQVPEDMRASAFRRMLIRANAADAYRKRFGRAHPVWGNGSLMAIASPGVHGPEPFLDAPDYCRCLSLVFDMLVDWRSERAR